MASLALTKKELDYLYAQRVERFRPAKFRSTLRIDSSVPGWAERIEIEKIALYAEVLPIARNADTARKPTMDRSSGYLRLFDFGCAYEINYTDLERARQLGIDYQNRATFANQTAAEKRLNAIAFLGFSNPTIPGLATNAAAISAVVSGSNITASSDPSVDLAICHALVNRVHTTSKELFTGDTLVMPLSTYQIAAVKRLSEGTEETVLGALLKQNPYLRRVLASYELETASAGAGKRMIAFDSIAEEGPKMIISRELTDYPPVNKLFGFEVGQQMATAGVLIEADESIAYHDLT